MGFETVVLNKVEEVLGTNSAAEFVSGTLFVGCSAAEAAKIETELLAFVNCGIIVTPQCDIGEFSFDFTV